MSGEAHHHRDPEIDRLIKVSDELAHRARELSKRSPITKERLAELDKNAKEILINCERLMGLLQFPGN